jgi:Rrf2 family protein
MRINKGVEWAVHACSLLAPLEKNKGLSLAALAAYHGIPAPYMAKQMQLLSTAGIVRTSRGKNGGYALARAPSQISIWDIQKAIEGNAQAFRCTEIRQSGPCALSKVDCATPCAIAAAFQKAETAYREVLRTISLVDVMTAIGGHASSKHLNDIYEWFQTNTTIMPDVQH